MTLATCDRCGKTLLSGAATCPGCGSVVNLPAPGNANEPAGKCPDCGGPVWKIKGLQGGREFRIFFLLFFLGLFPGLLYYMHAEHIAYCLHCHRRVKHPLPA